MVEDDLGERSQRDDILTVAYLCRESLPELGSQFRAGAFERFS